jgi:hypothetical protein
MERPTKAVLLDLDGMNLPFEAWTGVLGHERLTGALLDRLTHRIRIRRATCRHPSPDSRSLVISAMAMGSIGRF